MAAIKVPNSSQTIAALINVLARPLHASPSSAGVTTQALSESVFNSHITVPCQESRPNNRSRSVVPDGVCVSLQPLGYGSSQWGNLQEFFGEPSQTWWEDGVQYFGVEFGGSVGWHKVRAIDCRCLEWRQ